MNINFDPAVTCCFAGYRPHRYDFSLLGNDPQYLKLVNNITETTKKSYSEGYRNFIFGGAMGFDLLSAEIVINLRDQLPELKVICMLPFENQAKRFSKPWLDKYRFVLENCDRITYTSAEYTVNCCSERSEKMLNSSSRLITYFDGKDGGTARSVALAQYSKMDIVNLCEETPIPEIVNFFTGRRRY